MKLFRTILLILSGILLIPCSLITTAGAIWYLLPDLATTELGIWLSTYINGTTIFWVTIGCAITLAVLMILNLIFGIKLSAKLRNFFIHFTTWAICALSICLSVYAFIYCNPLVAQEVTISIPRKISIGVTLLLLMAFHIFSNKIKTIINRRIQSYETVKEMNVVGRSSIVWVNFLKLFEVFFPEMLILLLICYCVSWNVASYFIIILVSSLIPLIGNIICDLNIRNQAKRKQKEEQEKLSQMIADKVKGDHR